AGRWPCRLVGCINVYASRAAHIGCGPKQRTSGLLGICLCQRRRFALLRSRPVRQLPSRHYLCRSHSTRREAGRSPGAVSGEIRDGRESQDRQGARPRSASDAARPRRRGDRMTRRREFITLLGGAAAGWPIVARAQQRERMRRIGVLSGLAADDQDIKVRLVAFQQRLQQLGWTDGHNVRIDYRFAAANAQNYRKYAAELVALAPDVIL